jgi:hypothetical protein
MQGFNFNFPFPVDAYFFVGLAIGALIIALTSLSKFDEPTTPPADGDLIRQLLPKDLTTHEEYLRAFLFYYLAPMLFLLCAIGLIGPGFLQLGGIDLPKAGWGAGVWPIGSAMMLAGLINVAWVKTLELQLRRFAHDRAYIPERGRATAERLRIADFDFSGYRKSLSAPAMSGVKPADFQSDPDSIEFAWARLSCLSYKISRRSDTDGSADLEGGMLERYAAVLEDIAARRHAMARDMDQYRTDAEGGHGAPPEELASRIETAFRQLCLLLGCAVLLKHGRKVNMAEAFQPFGFRLLPISREEGNQNVIIVGLTVMTAAILMIVFAAVMLAWAFGGGRGWTPSHDYPTQAFDPFLWAVSAAIMYGTAILVADRARAKSIRKQRWFAGHASDPANYVRIAATCAVAGYIMMCLFGSLFQGLTPGLLAGAAPYALLPGVTGAFYAAHLDNVALATRPSALREIGLQALMTGACAAIAAPVWLRLGPGALGAADFIALSAVLGLTAGATLGWYIPGAAEARRITPLLVAREARLAKLSEVARDRFVSADLAQQWLHQPNRDLDDQTPLAAAEDVDRYYKVVSLLPRTKEATVA